VKQSRFLQRFDECPLLLAVFVRYGSTTDPPGLPLMRRIEKGFGIKAGSSRSGATMEEVRRDPVSIGEPACRPGKAAGSVTGGRASPQAAA